jgi:hypothetical protein
MSEFVALRSRMLTGTFISGPMSVSIKYDFIFSGRRSRRVDTIERYTRRRSANF